MKHWLSVCFAILFVTCSISFAQEPMFALDSAYVTGETPLFVKTADFDLDGFPDLVVANYGSGNAHFFFNNGDGTFSRTRSYDLRGAPTSIDVGDVSGDGYDDLITVNENENVLVVLCNNGNGTFRGADVFSGFGGTAVAVDNVNPIGAEDLVVVKYGWPTVIAIWNLYGDQVDLSLYQGERHHWALKIADLDNDGRSDIAISNGDVQFMTIILWGYTFAASYPQYEIGGGGIAIDAADFDSDGFKDLVVARDPIFFPGISVLLNSQNRQFEYPIDYEIFGSITDLVTGDFDGLNGIDIAVTNWGFEPYVTILFNDGIGNFNNRIDVSIQHPGYGMTTADFDCDKDLDIAVVWPFDNQLAVFVNNTAKEAPFMIPARIFAAMAHPINPTPGVLTIKNFTNGHRSTDVDTASIRINGTIELSSFTILYPESEPCDKFIRAEFPLQEFILGYGVLWDSTVQTYSVTGQYNDGIVFGILGEVTMVGHRSGDLNRDGQVGIADLSALVNYIFRGGPAPSPNEAGDIDGRCGTTNISDLNYFVNFLFRGGPAPTHVCLD